MCLFIELLGEGPPLAGSVWGKGQIFQSPKGGQLVPSVVTALTKDLARQIKEGSVCCGSWFNEGHSPSWWDRHSSGNLRRWISLSWRLGSRGQSRREWGPPPVAHFPWKVYFPDATTFQNNATRWGSSVQTVEPVWDI